VEPLVLENHDTQRPTFHWDVAAIDNSDTLLLNSYTTLIDHVDSPHVTIVNAKTVMDGDESPAQRNDPPRVVSDDNHLHVDSNQLQSDSTTAQLQSDNVTVTTIPHTTLPSASVAAASGVADCSVRLEQSSGLLGVTLVVSRASLTQGFGVVIRPSTRKQRPVLTTVKGWTMAGASGPIVTAVNGVQVHKFDDCCAAVSKCNRLLVRLSLNSKITLTPADQHPIALPPPVAAVKKSSLQKPHPPPLATTSSPAAVHHTPPAAVHHTPQSFTLSRSSSSSPWQLKLQASADGVSPMRLLPPLPPIFFPQMDILGQPVVAEINGILAPTPSALLKVLQIATNVTIRLDNGKICPAGHPLVAWKRRRGLLSMERSNVSVPWGIRLSKGDRCVRLLGVSHALMDIRGTPEIASCNGQSVESFEALVMMLKTSTSVILHLRGDFSLKLRDAATDVHAPADGKSPPAAVAVDVTEDPNALTSVVANEASGELTFTKIDGLTPGGAEPIDAATLRWPVDVLQNGDLSFLHDRLCGPGLPFLQAASTVIPRASSGTPPPRLVLPVHRVAELNGFPVVRRMSAKAFVKTWRRSLRDHPRMMLLRLLRAK
jgi:hypothetical protein